MLSGTGALLYLAIVGKTQPVDISALVASYVPDKPLDQFNPVLAMLQTWVERSEPANYAPLIARAPITGDDGQKLAPKDILQTEGFDDHYVPNTGIEAYATALRRQSESSRATPPGRSRWSRAFCCAGAPY